MDSQFDFWVRTYAELALEPRPEAENQEVIDSDLQKELQSVLEAAKDTRERQPVAKESVQDVS